MLSHQVKKSVFVLLAISLLISCGKEPKRPNEDSLLAVQAFGVADGLKDTYSRKNFSGLKRFCTKEGYDLIIRDIKKFHSVDLEFTPRWVEIKVDGTVYLNVSWKGKWTMPDKVVEERGMAVFELVDRPLRLARIIRSSPFSQPEPLKVP